MLPTPVFDRKKNIHLIKLQHYSFKFYSGRSEQDKKVVTNRRTHIRISFVDHL